MSTNVDQKLLLAGGRILASILVELKQIVAVGVATMDLENKARAMIKQAGVRPAFLGFGKYPAVLCTCVNMGIVHCVPRIDEILKNGDIISLDLGIEYQGYFFDAALTVPVGEVSESAHRLILVAKKALKRGLKKARVGNTTGDIGNTIERYVKSQGFSVIPELCGHGIGRRLHEDPQICIEPMICNGSGKITKAKDGFGWQTADGSLAAHFEHTILVKKGGCLVLT